MAAPRFMLLTRRNAIGIAAAAAAASSTSLVRPIYAEGQERLPIYSDAAPEPQVIEAHTVLEKHVGDARQAFMSSTEQAREAVHQSVSKWVAMERRVEKRVLNILPPDEPLNPGALYVGVATLAGSVFGRYRSFPIRIISPPIFLLASLNFFLPKTSHNLSQYYQEIEAAHFPSVSEPRQNIARSIRSLYQKSEGSAKEVGQQAESGWRVGLNKFQETTGLKVTGEPTKAD